MAYREGCFPDAPKEMDAQAFREWATAELVRLISAGSDAFLLSTKEAPVGIITVQYVNHPQLARQFHPHVYWLAEASPRNKLECWLHFLIEMKRDAKGIITTAPENWLFFSHLCKYGVLRRVGTFRQYAADGSSAGVFETVNA